MNSTTSFETTALRPRAALIGPADAVTYRRGLPRANGGLHRDVDTLR
jgi:hypothetical protein